MLTLRRSLTAAAVDGVVSILLLMLMLYLCKHHKEASPYSHYQSESIRQIYTCLYLCVLCVMYMYMCMYLNVYIPVLVNPIMMMAMMMMRPACV